VSNYWSITDVGVVEKVAYHIVHSGPNVGENGSDE